MHLNRAGYPSKNYEDRKNPSLHRSRQYLGGDKLDTQTICPSHFLARLTTKTTSENRHE